MVTPYNVRTYASPTPVGPKGDVIKFEKWRSNAAENHQVVTVFEFSAMSSTVKACSGLVTSIADGPHAQDARAVRIRLMQRNRQGKTDIVECGREWPAWTVVVEDDHTKVEFPRLPEDFDDWFISWTKRAGVKVIADWRAEARRDGSESEWHWEQAHQIARDARTVASELKTAPETKPTAEAAPEPPVGRFDEEADRRGSTGKRFDLVAFNDIRMSTAPNYTVKGLLPGFGMAIVWGPPKCGKSFLVSDLLLHVALGWEYRGRKVKGGPVVYLCLEGAQGFVNRLEAFRQSKLADNAEPVPFYICPTPLGLIADHLALIAAVKDRLGNTSPAVICIDTVNRSLVGSESSDADMGAYIKAADAIRDAFNCLVVLVHHCGLDATRPRGHTSLTGALDVQIAVKRDGQAGISALVEFNKDGPEGAEVLSRLAVVEIGTDDDGDPITSCVVEAVDDGGTRVAEKKSVKLSDLEKLGLEALHATCLETGRPVPLSFGIVPCPRGVRADEWKAEMVRRGVLDGEGSGTSRSKLSRIRDGLFAKHKAAERDGIVWPSA